MMRNIKPMASSGIHEKVLDIIASKIIKGKDQKILVAASGNGAFEYSLLKKNKDIKPENIFPVDISKNYQFIECKKNFRIADLNNNIPHPNKYFDIIVCIETVEHLYNHKQALAEFDRVLKSNGILIITTPNCESLASRIYYALFGIFPSFTEIHYKGTGHVNPFFSWYLPRYCKNMKIINYDSNNFHMWIIPYILKIPAFKNILFAECNIWTLRKEK